MFFLEFRRRNKNIERYKYLVSIEGIFSGLERVYF